MNNISENNNENSEEYTESYKKEDIEELIGQNLELSEEILRLTKYIKKYVFWQKIMGWLKFFLIAIPIALAIIYVPPFLEKAMNSLQEVLDLSNFAG
jgi:hypothetical protein